jgi:regulator of sigma E protease
MITALAFVATLALLVVIHEYGHYRAALACGVKVMRFSVGFGRVLWRRQVSPQATEFVVCMLPLGGYVRMLDDREGPIDPAQSHQAFNRKPLWQRAFVVFAGPAANLLLAVFLYSAVQWMGVLEPQAVLSAPPAQSVAARAGLKSGDWVRAWSADGLSWQEVRSMVDLRWRALDARVNGKPLYLMVSDSQGRGSRAVRLDAPAGSRSADPEAMRELGLGAPWSPAVLGEIKPGGPADQAGLRAGDKVVTVDGLPIQDAQALREAIQARPGQTSTGIVLRTEGTVQVEVRPRTQRAGQGTVGKIDAFVGLAAPTVMVSMGPLDGLIEGVNKTWDVSVLTVSTIGRMIVGQASIKNLSGPLTIADYAGQSAQKGWSSYLAFLALVSVSLGILNLLPLPMLDGGHLMDYLFEGLTGRPVSDAWLERLQRGGIAILLTLMSVALFNDVARLVGFH